MSNNTLDDDDDATARWAIRLYGRPLSNGEQSELDAWLLADERRGGALLRAEAMLVYLDSRRMPVAVPVKPFEADVRGA